MNIRLSESFLYSCLQDC